MNRGADHRGVVVVVRVQTSHVADLAEDKMQLAVSGPGVEGHLEVVWSFRKVLNLMSSSWFPWSPIRIRIRSGTRARGSIRVMLPRSSTNGQKARNRIKVAEQ